MKNFITNSHGQVIESNKLNIIVIIYYPVICTIGKWLIIKVAVYKGNGLLSSCDQIVSVGRHVDLSALRKHCMAKVQISLCKHAVFLLPRAWSLTWCNRT